MSEDNGYKDAFNFHRSAQNKFEYFFLGVILASLSLSVQSFNPAIENQQAFLIYLSWFLFLISFLSGFFRQERLNLSYMIVAQTYPEKEKKRVLEQAQTGEVTLIKSANNPWSTEEIQKLLENTNSIVELSKDYLTKYEKHSLIAYQIEKWTFFYAIYAYIIFKVSNYSNLSILLIAIITVIVFVTNIILLKYYKRILRNK